MASALYREKAKGSFFNGTENHELCYVSASRKMAILAKKKVIYQVLSGIIRYLIRPSIDKHTKHPLDYTVHQIIKRNRLGMDSERVLRTLTSV